MKFCQTATLWISNCATSWNFKLRLPAKYYTNSHETNCSNSPINTAFRRGIIHICQLFHCKAYFDKPQTATLNYSFRLNELNLYIVCIVNAWFAYSDCWPKNEVALHSLLPPARSWSEHEGRILGTPVVQSSTQSTGSTVSCQCPTSLSSL